MNGWMNERIKESMKIIASMNQTANETMNYAILFPDPNSFLGFEVETELSPYSLVRILPTSSSKSVPIPADPLIFCALFIFYPTLATPRATWPKKNTGFRARDCSHP